MLITWASDSPKRMRGLIRRNSTENLKILEQQIDHEECTVGPELSPQLPEDAETDNAQDQFIHRRGMAGGIVRHNAAGILAGDFRKGGKHPGMGGRCRSHSWFPREDR